MHANPIPALIIAVAASGVGLLAGEVLPPQSLPLSTVLSKLEQSGLGPIVEVGLDDGIWEVEAFRNNQSVELNVSTNDGRILSEHPDSPHVRPASGVMTASAIAKALETGGYSQVLEMDLKGKLWEVEAISTAGRRELHVDAVTGKVINDVPEG